MKPNQKKEKIKEPPRLTFMDLNDDSIFQILWYLSSKDLCSMSFTCKRLRQLAFDHFPRQYPDEQVTIGDSSWCWGNKMSIEVKQNFRKCIRNVRIESWDTHENLQRLFDYVDSKSCADWRSFELDISGLLKEIHVTSIRNRLRKLSTLIIKSPHDRLDIHNALLKYCENLECLDLVLYSSFDSFWMLNIYPTIKTLNIGLKTLESEKFFNAKAKKFFQLNPQIKNIQYYGSSGGMETFLQNVIIIERLTLIPLHRIDWLPIIKQLICNTKQNKIEWLHLKIGFQTKYEICMALADLNAVQPISELEYILAGFRNELIFLSQLKSVQKLTLECNDDYEIGDELFDVLSKQLPNLRDLELCLRDYDGLFFKWITMKFIENSLKMKNLTFMNCSSDTFIFHPNDVVELNQRRSSISCASPVLIQCKFRGDKFATPALNNPPITAVVNVKFGETFFELREVRH